MSDLVKELRKMGRNGFRTCRDAADEIERLRATVEAARRSALQQAATEAVVIGSLETADRIRALLDAHPPTDPAALKEAIAEVTLAAWRVSPRTGGCLANDQIMAACAAYVAAQQKESTP